MDENRGLPRGGSAAGMKEGFTLLEVLVAMALMALSITLILQLLAADLGTIARSGHLISAAVSGDGRIRELLDEPWLLEERCWSETTQGGRRIDIAVTEVLRERTASLPVKLMEVTLVVRWREGRREKNLGLKTVKMVDRRWPPKTGPGPEGWPARR